MNPPMKKPILLLALLPWLGGCADLGVVHAWEKGNLAKPGMALNDDPLEQRYLQHIYTSKEAANGGTSVGGGGCGCN
mgnify:CR=1 FL=1